MPSKDYSFIKKGYIFPISNIMAMGDVYDLRDAPTPSNPRGALRHYVDCLCPYCKQIFRGRLDRLTFNPITTTAPRTLCCKACSLTHKRSAPDPWRSSDGNNAEKQGINIKRTLDLSGKLIGDLKVGNAKDGKTDKFGLAWWPCTCTCGRHEYVRGNTLHGALNGSIPKTACSNCLNAISSGERAITEYLKKNNITNFKTQYTFEDLKGDASLLRFDFAILDKNNKPIILIEFQGRQHYEAIDYFGGTERFLQQQRYDTYKRLYCKAHNIQLIEIPYNYTDLNTYLDFLKPQ